MNTVGKIQASLSSATQETTLALAQANFDFSLIKIEAPAEYQELGLALPTKKRSEAENGSVHITARRLGSLFYSILPETPSLIQAYGKRSSEIAKSLATSSGVDESYGPFRDYIGVDGTSIWAAATSGKAAIACHLLACMLACCWRPEEATAIWIEIVAERRRQLEEKVAHAEYFKLAEAVSSKVSLDKEQLATWDNSARAWLAAADDSPAVRLRQKAVRGLLNKVNGTVHSQRDVFTSVMTAWKLALETLEKVIRGMSCSITDGAVVVALMSWHIYPDLILLDPETTIKKQKDDLVHSGQVTIGLVRPDTMDHTGVHWSLSLAHLRYYGADTITSRSIHCTPSGNARFTFDEFLLIALGACMRNWSKNEEITIEAATDFIIQAMSKFDEVLSTIESFSPHIMEGSWVRLIGSSLSIFKTGSHSAQSNASKFLTIGWRYPKLVEIRQLPTNLPQFCSFGLGTISFSGAFLNEEDRDSYIRDSIESFMNGSSHQRLEKSTCVILVPRNLETGSVIFYSRTSWKPSKLGRGDYKEITELCPDGGYVIKHKPGAIKIRKEGHLDWKDIPFPIYRILRGLRSSTNIDMPTCEEHFRRLTKTRSHFVYSNAMLPPIPNRQVEHYLSTKAMDPSRLLCFLRESSFFLIPRALSASQQLYTELPGATISPSVLEADSFPNAALPLSYLNQTRYLPRSSQTPESIVRYQLTQPQAFKFLVFMETGHKPRYFYNAHQWDDILAISIENTLYIDPAILHSPRLDSNRIPGIHRVQGNVGMPGVAILTQFAIDPHFTDQHFNLKKADPNNWQVVNHRPFDGKLEDCFANTTLHLRFTGYSQPLDFGAHNQIANGTIVDTVVSAFDQGQWLGEMKIPRPLGTLNAVRMIDRWPNCYSSIISKPPQRELVTIENWEELLNPHPSLPAVIKCHGNWQARLTAVSICAQLRYRTLFFHSHGCWDCAFKTLDAWDKETPPKARFTLSMASDSENEDNSSQSTETISNNIGSSDSYSGGADNNKGNALVRDTSSDSESSSSESDVSSLHSRFKNRPIIFIL